MKTGDQLLEMIQEKYPDYHPLMAVADIANQDDSTIGQKMEASKTVLKYTLPELKSIDISGQIDHNLSVLELLVSDEYAGDESAD